MPLLTLSPKQSILPLSFSLKIQQRWMSKRRFLGSCVGVTFSDDNNNLYATTTTTGRILRPDIQNRSQQPYLTIASKRNYCMSKSVLFPEAAIAEKSKADTTSAPFQYPKSEELFRRIIQRCKTQEDARALQRTVYELLGKPLRDFEFLIDGFGGKKSKGSGGGGGGGEVVEPVKEVQKIFDVKLVGYDASIKLKVIKEIRTILPALGLKEAKELVESAPCTLQKGLQPEQAEAIKQKLSDLGAQIELV